MSKERARRREVRELEAAERAAVRAAKARRRARREALVEPVLGPARRLRVSLTTGRQSGVLAERRRTRVRVLVGLLLFAQLVIWVLRPDWQARLAALIVSAFVFLVASVFTL
ncbi:MAG: hypothetical protein ACJ72E_16085 [Marmoricola sp.]